MLETYKDEMSTQIKQLKSDSKSEKDRLEEEIKMKSDQIEWE